MGDSTSDDDQRDRAIRLFRFLRELANLEYRPTRSIDKYVSHVWLSDIAEDKASLRIGADSWFSVMRVVLPELPMLPEELEPWLDLKSLSDWKSDLELPESTSCLVDEGEADEREVVLDLSDYPDVAAAWSTYKPEWDRWRAERKALDPEYQTYVDMFRMYQRVQQSGEQFELRLGVGLLEGSFPAAVRRHLTSAPIDLEMEDDGTITVREASFQSAGFVLEDDMLPTDSRPPADTADQTRALVAEIDDLLDSDSVKSALNGWFAAVDVDARFDHSWGVLPKAGLTRVTHAPAVFLRKRTQRNLVATYDNIIGQLRDGQPVPDTVRDMISFSGGEFDSHQPSTQDSSDRVYFPLAASPQQRSIVRQLSSRRGIVVQGPPGTGKSQTIANLICHALASGQRVLVTSHTSRALKVLQDKLPDEFRFLAVSATGEGKASSEDVRQSASQLLNRMNDPGWSQAALADRSDSLQSKLADLEQRRQQLVAGIAEATGRQFGDVDLGGDYRGDVSVVARRLANDQGELDWIPDEVLEGDVPGDEAELRQIVEFKQWRDQLSPAERSRRVADPSRLPSPDSVRIAFGAATDAQQRISDPDEFRRVVRAVNLLPADERSSLEHLARDVIQHERSVDGRSLEWMLAARSEVELGRDEAWRELAGRTAEFLDSADSIGSFRDKPPISDSLAEVESLSYQGERVLEHLKAGKSLGGIFKSKVVKESSDFLALDLDGRPLSDAPTCQGLLDRLSLNVDLLRCESRWQSKLPGVAHQGATMAERISRLSDAQESLGLVLGLHDARVRLGAAMRLPDPEILPTSASRIVEYIAVQELEGESRRVSEALDAIDTGPDGPNRFVYFGDCRSALEDRDADAYQSAYRALAASHDIYQRLQAGETVEQRWREACPLTVEHAGRLLDDPAVDTSRFDEAWAWRRARTLLSQQFGVELTDQFRTLGKVNNEIRLATGELGSVLAWRQALANLTNEQTQHLKAYQKALERLGKGTGKRAAQHRESARQHLAACQDAIPAWIVPTFRLAETMVPRPETFDLVIVDEASQSGSTALFLLWLGRQMVIVGDDQQISPSNVGMSDSDVAKIQSDYLDGFELKDMFDAKHSLFDQASTRYRGATWLTEHFRCMPEIIEFSNRAIYEKLNNRLEPLRQFGSDRLPPLRRVFVPDGSDVDGVNEAEAEAVADAVLRCFDDPAYDGMTFGVISLLGDKQAELIERLIQEQVGDDMTGWEERQLRCGNAYAFQGDERDVIFLSMVKGPSGDGHRLRKLPGKADGQRFNVAASRARDQMWLFHSVRPEDLNPECIRAQLLDHFSHAPDRGDLVALGHINRGQLTAPFQSLLAQCIYLDLAEMDYRIEPGVTAYGQRLDLVVSGDAKRVAIDCGERFTASRDIGSVLGAHQELERVGWEFIQVNAAEYYLNPQETLKGVIDRLTGAGVHPAGVNTAEDTVVVSEVREARIGDPQPVETPETPPAEPEIPVTAEIDAPEGIPPKAGSLLVRDDTEESASPTESLDYEPARAERVAPSRRLASFDDIPAEFVDVLPEKSAPESAEPRSPGLAEYEEWTPKQLRPATSIGQMSLARDLLEIINVEGPITSGRLYRTANSAAGYRRLGQQLRNSMDEAVAYGETSGWLTVTSIDGEDCDIIRAPHHPAVKLRKPGPRTIYEYPIDELKALVRHLEETKRVHGEALHREVIKIFGIKRLKEPTQRLIEEARRYSALR